MAVSPPRTASKPESAPESTEGERLAIVASKTGPVADQMAGDMPLDTAVVTAVEAESKSAGQVTQLAEAPRLSVSRSPALSS
ncbi:hypothetical protein, partial [Opacimonas viscosa]